MENEKQLIPLQKRTIYAGDVFTSLMAEKRWSAIEAADFMKDFRTVDTVEAPDKEMLKAIKILIKQYEHSTQSDYVHNPIAHAFFHTWKQLDESGYGERRNIK